MAQTRECTGGARAAGGGRRAVARSRLPARQFECWSSAQNLPLLLLPCSLQVVHSQGWVSLANPRLPFDSSVCIACCTHSLACTALPLPLPCPALPLDCPPPHHLLLGSFRHR